MENFKNRWRQIVEKTDTPAGKAFDVVVLCLIVLSLILIPLETMPQFSKYEAFFHVLDRGIITLFTAEYLLRVFVSEKRWGFIFSFSGIIDFLAIAPFLFALADWRFIRIFRLFRVFRIFKLVRYINAMRRFHFAFREIKDELVVFGFATFALVYIAAVGIYYFEHPVQPELFKSIGHSLWWAIVTLTTVGYGDAYPVTIGGKIFTSFILLLGIAVVSVPSALMASALIKTSSSKSDGVVTKGLKSSKDPRK